MTRARDPERTGRLVAVVDLGATRGEEEPGAGADGILAPRVVGRPVVVRADVVEDRGAGERASQEVT